MKKLVVLTVLLMAVPALAAPSAVGISVTKTGPNEFTIGYTTDANLVRAFGLDIIVDDPCVSIAVNCAGNTDYYVYPSSITISGTGVPGPWGQCDVATSDANHVIIEMGSLYAPGDLYGHTTAPPTSGNLAVVTMTGCDSVSGDGDDTVTVKVEENALSGGVVMENVDEVPNLSSPGGTVVHELGVCSCYSGMADWDEFVAVGMPECWCYPRQCLGDADGQSFGAKDHFWVSIPDLTILKAAWNKAIGDMTDPTWICADFDHAEFGAKDHFRVSIPDLTILKNNWNIPDGPDGTCLPGNSNP